MNLEFDQDKRDKTLLERGLDFARAVEVFEGIHFTGQDARLDYEEDRFITSEFFCKSFVECCSRSNERHGRNYVNANVISFLRNKITLVVLQR